METRVRKNKTWVKAKQVVQEKINLILRVFRGKEDKITLKKATYEKTDVSLQSEKSIPLQSEKSISLQSEKSIPLQSEKSILLQSEKSIPLQSEKSIPLQGEESNTLQGEKLNPLPESKINETETNKSKIDRAKINSKPHKKINYEPKKTVLNQYKAITKECTKERNRTKMNIKGICEKYKNGIKETYKRSKEKMKGKFIKRKKAFLGGCASVLTIVLLVSIFAMQFTINKTDTLTDNPAKQLASSSKYIIYNIDNEELPITDSEGNEIVTKQYIDGKEYYIVETDERGDITRGLSKGVYKVVKVNQLSDGYELGEETSFIQVSDNNEVSEIEVQEFNITNTYIGPEISSTKTYETQYNEDYVVEGEEITYTITVENSGKMEKEVVIRDTIPDGTTFKDESIVVTPPQDNAPEAGYTENSLKEGIVVKVPEMKTSELEGVEGTKGKVTVTFVVTVNQLEKGKYSKKIENTAMVDDEPTATIEVMVNKEVPVQLDEIEVTNTYIGPVISEDKTFTTEQNQAYVKENEKITYSITVENSGLVAKNVKIKDTIPEGTTFKSESILVDGKTEYSVDTKVIDDQGTRIEKVQKNANQLTETNLTTDGIELTVPAGQQQEDGSITNGEVTLSFVVTVNKFGEEANGKPDYSKTIVNMAEVDDVPTRKVVVVATKNLEGTTKDVTIVKKDSKDKKGLEGAEFTLQPNKTDVTSLIKQVKVTPNLQVTKTITSTPNNSEAYTEGERIKYEVTVKNTGNVALKELKVKDTVLENVENTTSTLIATYNNVENEFTLSKDLLAGETKKITYEYKVTQKDIEETTLNNKVETNAQSITVTAKAITEANDEITANNATETVTQSVNTYTFESSDEKYVSNNNAENSKAIAYIPIDLTTEESYKGKNTLVVNAGINGGISDYGYAIVVEGENVADNYDYSDLDKAFIAINGKRQAQDYKITLEGDKKYTLILIYAKDEIHNEEEDAFTINSVKVVQNEGGKEEEITLRTEGEDGTATEAKVPYGIYTLTETQAPEHYKQLDAPIEIEVGDPNKILEDSTDEKVKISVEAETGNFVVENATSRVKVHHYLRGTEESDAPVSVSPDEEFKGVAGVDDYEISGKDGLEKYERETGDDGLPKKPVDKEGNEVEETGKFEEEDKEVTYYYVWKKAEIDSSLTKTSEVEKITQKDQAITYKIEYTATISQYEGKATITIVDHLPYKLDLEKMKQDEDLAKGVYNEEQDTITWTITEDEINTYSDGNDKPQKTITIVKNIKLIFKNIDANATELRNTVNATLELETTNQEDEADPATEEIPAEFNKSVVVTKTWDYGSEKNVYAKPTKVKLELYNKNNLDEKIGEEVILTGAEGAEWTHTFTDLKKFDENNEEIIYTVKEFAVEGESLAYYDSQITPSESEIKIVNTYKGPEISKEKSVEIFNKGIKVGPETREYALVEDTLKYTITVTNAGGVAKDVIIKDEAPEGTTFKEGSIQINGEGTYKVDGTDGQVDVNTKKAEDLKNGIKVTVPAATPALEGKTNGQITLSFEVDIVDNLTKENGFTKRIKNKATIVDEDATNKPDDYTEETEETDTLVNKSNIEFSKSSSREQDSKVSANDEIEYIIEVKNTGTAPEDVTIQDSEPEDTTYVADSFNFVEGDVEAIAASSYTMDSLKEGITLTLQPSKKVTIKFKVKINEDNKYNNAEKIRNKAKVNDQDTNEVTHKYVEPIINQTKSVSTEKSKEYVLENELITYTIKVTNAGEKEKVVAIKDTIPDGTQYEEETLQITSGDGQNVLGEHKINELQSADGLKIEVPAAEDKNQNEEIEENEYGTITLTFKVRVKPLVDGTYTTTISNIAYVDEVPTETKETEVRKPNVTISKLAQKPENNTEVKAGEQITYKIILDNSLGTVEDTVKVKDIIPTSGISYDETTLDITEIDGQKVDGSYLFTNLIGEGIDITVPAGKRIAITFTVNVTGEGLLNDAKIVNKAEIVGGKETEEVTHTFVKPIITSEKSAEVESLNPNDEGYALEGDTIKYTITLTNKGGAEGKVKVKDVLPKEVEYTQDATIEVKANGIPVEAPTYTIAQLISDEGIEITVPSATKAEEGRTASTVTLVFEVKVRENVAIGDNGYTTKITNKANVDEDEPQTETEVRKEHITSTKTADPVTGTTVKENDKIKYTITVTNDGTAPKKVKVVDKIPQGTTFNEEKPVEVKGDESYEGGKEYKTDGEGNRIETEVTVPPATIREQEEKVPGTVTITFEVTVGNMQNGDTITNKATIDEEETGDVTHTYIEPIIKSQKTSEIIGKDGHKVTGREYALEGEKIKYTITVTNEGDLKGNVTIKDTIPSGTTFVNDSIRVDGEKSYSVDQKPETTEGKTGTDLQTGIKVTVPARTNVGDSGKTAGKVELSFEVTIDKTVEGPYTRKIGNTATVVHEEDEKDDENPKSQDVTVNKPHITVDKTATTTQNTADENTVAKGDEITYLITVTNDGYAPEEVLIKDSIPTGTTFKEGTLKVKIGENSQSEYQITDLKGEGINITVPAASMEDELVPGKVTVEFTVTVTGTKQAELSEQVELNDKEKIENTATIVKNPDETPEDTETTKPVEHTYVKPIITAEKDAEILDSELQYAIAGNQIEYTITLKNTGNYEGEATIQDTIPDGTEFVDGSITIEPQQDGAPEEGYTQTNLSDGIKVKVEAGKDSSGNGIIEDSEAGKTVLKFKVKVKALTEEDAHTKVIENTATVKEEGKNDPQTPSKEITVNESEITIEKTSAVEDEQLENDDKQKGNAKIDSKIKYTITVNNSGTAVETVKVTDKIPEGTKFDERSIKVNNEPAEDKTEEDLTTNGIDVTVQPSGKATVEFTVTVTGTKVGLEADSKLNNGDKIKNKATAKYGNEKTQDSDEVINTYIEPIISSTKKAIIEHEDLGYVKAGEEITYEITVKNEGGYKGEVVIKDPIPAGTTFVEDSIEINGSKESQYDENSLKETGITVTVPAATLAGEELTPGEVKLTFKVTVKDIEDEQLTKQIQNTAQVTHKGKEEQVPSEPVTENKAKITVEKKIKTTEELETVDGGKVAKNAEITYVIYVKNSGPAKETVKVKDIIPEGTQFISESLTIDGDKTYNDENLSDKNAESLKEGIEVTVPAATGIPDGPVTPGQVKIEFKVQVTGNKTEGNLTDREEIKNTASAEDEKQERKDSNEVKNTYVEPIINSTKNAEIVNEAGEKVQGREYALEGDIIKYTITVTNAGGLAKNVKIKDEIPNGTTLVPESIKVDPVQQPEKTYEQADLTTNGIEVKVQEATDTGDGIIQENEYGKVTLTFKVKVSELGMDVYEKTIGNTAYIDESGTTSNDIEVKKPKISVQKTSETADGKVEIGDTITYKITVTNEGTAPEEVLVKDTIPAGTELVENGIKIGGKVQTGKTAKELAEGLKVTVPEAKGDQEKVNGTVEVEVTVEVTGTKGLDEKLQDREKIENTASIDEEPENPENPEKTTDKVEHTYVEPIISSTKTSKIYDKKGSEVLEREYALEGETIEYTITVLNKGGADKDVIIKDTIPEGTEFEIGSIRVNGEETYFVKGAQQQANTKTQTQLKNGIEVNVPAAQNKDADENITDEEAGRTTLSFKVKVSALDGANYKGTIQNTAYVDNDEKGTPAEDIEVKKPHITIAKSSTTAGNQVPEKSEITYVITLTNDGYAPGEVIVKDVIPEGTEFKAESLSVVGTGTEGHYTLEELASNGLRVTVPAKTDERVNGTVTITFTVTVTGETKDSGELANKAKITNTATMDKDVENPGNPENQEETLPVEHTYVKPIIKTEKTSTIKDSELSYAVAGDKIEYTITITNSGDYKGTVTVKDEMPEGVSYNDGDSVIVKTEGQEEQSQHTIQQLKQGFEVTVPAKSGSVNGKVTVTFVVTVNEVTNHESHKATIRNTATVGEDNPSSETVVNEAALAVSKKATVEDAELEEGDKQAGKVKVGSIITYTITVSNTGTAHEKVKVEDEIPEGTRFVAESVTVGGEPRPTITEEELKTGIDVDVPAKSASGNGKVVVTFKVEVTGEKASDGKLANGDKITNVGKIKHENGHEDESRPVENTYIEPIISSAKTAEIYTTGGIKSSNDYALERETIKYTITVTNTGDYKGEVTIKDQIPDGTTFVNESIEIDGSPRIDLNDTSLSQGIPVTVPAKTDHESGTVVLTFKVTVDKIEGAELTKQIDNTATVTHKNEDKEVPSNPVTVKKPKMEITKEAVASTGKNEVTIGDDITYKIKLSNIGEAPGKAKVKDLIPTHTHLVEGSVKVGGNTSYGGKNLNLDGEATLRDGIEITVPAKQEVILEFTVGIDDSVDQTKIENFATVNKDTTDPSSSDEPTNTVTNKYIEAIIESEKSATIEDVEDREYAIEGDIIKYTITVTNKGGLEKQVTIIDDAPAGTTFQQGSIEVTGAKEASQSFTLEQLKGNGIKLTVPGATDDNENGSIDENEEEKVTLSFKVKVDKLDDSEYSKVIKNSAMVDSTPTKETQTTVNKPNIEVEKTSDTKAEVKVDDEITYKITVTNKGEAFGKVKVKDEIPEGTEFVSLTVVPEQESEKQYTKQDIEKGIDITVPAAKDLDATQAIEESEYTKVELTLVVKVTGKGKEEIELDDGYTIKNVAKYTVDEKETDTDEVTRKYVKPVISSAKTSNIEEGAKVKSGDAITYTITMTNEGGTGATVKVADQIPDKTTFKPGSIKINGTVQP